ncbi:MAG: FlgD immunoglobulin-like domain containing protein [Candidatus Cloacimonadaceae bacterium]|nr:FlgD immunoglobulin-like domain containing protein [Candidatus Cloacimonadaceae bacterium]
MNRLLCLTVLLLGTLSILVALTGYADSPEDVNLDYTLPVELSNLTAVYSSQHYVQLSWITQSESELSGYYVYRSDMEYVSSAICISGLIGAQNGSQTTHYSFTDMEISSGESYYYWLGAISLNGSEELFGPIFVSIPQNEEEDAPEIPIHTRLRPVYPNPVNPHHKQVHLKYELRSPELVKIAVYNLKGQAVRSYLIHHPKAGVYSIDFDGKDSRGNQLASGIYRCVMSAGSYRSSASFVIVK